MGREIYLSEFIKTIRGEIGLTIEISPYVSFLLICPGIELLGKCLDLEISHFNEYKPNRPPQQFSKAINLFFPELYDERFKEWKVYDQLRNGMLHSFIPKQNIVLFAKETEEFKNLDIDRRHNPHRLVIVTEVLYHHFSQACDSLIKMIDNKDDRLNSIVYRPILYLG